MIRYLALSFCSIMLMGTIGHYAGQYLDYLERPDMSGPPTYHETP